MDKNKLFNQIKDNLSVLTAIDYAVKPVLSEQLQAKILSDIKKLGGIND